MTEKEKKESMGISRREFLRDAGLIVGGTAIGSTVLLAACGGDGETETVTSTKTVTTTAAGGTTTVTKTEASGGTQTVTVTKTEGGTTVEAAENVITLTVNGQAYEMAVEPNWSLKDVLHNKLGYNSVKEWCDHGCCGSCTVIIQGRPVLSCMMLAIECDGESIQTAEGCAEENPTLANAYIMYHCMQCGYCTPGFFVTAKALLDKNSSPTEEDIVDALGGNLCRCATYPAHIRAIMAAAGGG